jgi:DNA polymerase III sliding clamp (beta) subunit (PCNA family)
MEFKVERKRLYDACRKVVKTTAPKSDKNELSGILLEADADRRVLRLTGTDLTVTMMMKLKDIDVSIPGKVVVPGTLFTEMLGAMTGETAEIMVQDSMVRVKSGISTFRAVTMNVENFPKIAIVPPQTTVCVMGLALISKQTATVVSSSNDEANYQGVQIRFSPDTSTATSSDGVRFMKSKGEGIADGNLDLFVSEKALKILYGIVRAGDELFIGEINNSAVFMTSEFVFSTRLTAGNLEKIETLMEKIVPKYTAVVDSKEFAQALDVCVSMTYGVDLCVNLTLMQKSLKLTVDNENGSSAIKVDAEKSTDMAGKVFHYRPTFIFDFLRTCSGKVIIELDERGIMKLRSSQTDYVVTPRKPAVIKVKEETDKNKTPVKVKTKKGKAAKKAA